MPALQSADGIDQALSPLFETLISGSASGIAPKEGGFNIEGLATDGKSLLIGLRSPVANGKAWILRLANPAAIVADVDEKPQITVKAQVDLGDGRGIRAMTESDDGWIIVGGLINDPPPSFGLFQCDKGPTAKSIDFTFAGGTRPEGIASQDSNVLMVSDDGSVLRNGVECKSESPANQYFRATSVPENQLVVTD